MEEREEYEPHLAAGNVVYAGVDYTRIVALAERECDLILWDGGNNDFPFVRPDLHIVLVDPLRPGHETSYHPGETVLRMADIVVVSKTDAAHPADAERVIASARRANPKASVVRAALSIRLDDPQAVRGRRVLVVEDGPTVTHGDMPWGAGYLAAKHAGARAIVDPRAFAAPGIASVYEQYPHIGPVLPAEGYSSAQLEALRQTINATAGRCRRRRHPHRPRRAGGHQQADRACTLRVRRGRIARPRRRARPVPRPVPWIGEGVNGALSWRG